MLRLVRRSSSPGAARASATARGLCYSRGLVDSFRRLHFLLLHADPRVRRSRWLESSTLSVNEALAEWAATSCRSLGLSARCARVIGAVPIGLTGPRS